MKERLTIFIVILLFIILIHSSTVHSRALAPSPSPAPVGGEPEAGGLNLSNGRGGSGKTMRGSFPAECHFKCNQCKPCMPVQVSVPAMEFKENDEYYPQVWKCICGEDIFSP
ncbi:EPIDERMAL PATTERNING FACTOR-like protein 4 [Manihot esculenta]|uniref:Epidermal patterning factor-like protein n=1 Tax=Manihot esculenta TaxID=3983 RepID=A0A2C9VK80_MANES|nr:EPIDERMAL PATTERNING FACTOR-like protein 4 [Manihot esculenta]OAY45413.1 hypothetical protein MANES_07G058600v8 [Manihot esculenta]